MATQDKLAEAHRYLASSTGWIAGTIARKKLSRNGLDVAIERVEEGLALLKELKAGEKK